MVQRMLINAMVNHLYSRSQSQNQSNEGQNLRSQNLRSHLTLIIMPLFIPPSPENEEDETEFSMLDGDEDDDDGGLPCSTDSFSRKEYRNKDKLTEEHGMAMKAVVDKHFRFLVTQLLRAENIPIGEENDGESWKEIVSMLSWQAAAYIKPDASEGRAMDPVCYVKVKCVACGRRSESKVIKGVVFKKNIAHKHMPNSYKNPRLLLLGGALEYQPASNQLSSFNTLLQQEFDYLKAAVTRIDAHHPNVLLVEKTVSRHAQEFLLAKEISLVLNVKRTNLERLSQCTGAQIVSSLENLTTANVKHCELFHVEKFVEEHGSFGESRKKLTKTLMLFEGCTKPLGCTILLKGASGDELKKVKFVVQYAVFAAYHLALETSFLADERATLPRKVDSISLQSQSTFEHKQEGTHYEEQGFSKAGVMPSCSDHPSILVSLSRHCILKGTVCERNQISRIKYYGSFDMSLGRFLRDKLFNQNSRCHACEQPPDAHAYCYTHQEGRLMVSLQRIPQTLTLPGEQEGKIWMWHRCLKCEWKDGLPQPNRRVLMSDAASGLSFGNFLELSFSNNAASRVASCGHSLHRDCLRFYGLGSLVACFHYSSINILGVHLPPAKLEFNNPNQQDWLRKEATEVTQNGEEFFLEVLDLIHRVREKISSAGPYPPAIVPESTKIAEVEGMLQKERAEFEESLQMAITKDWQPGQPAADILELNRLRRKLIFESYIWDKRLCYLHSSLKMKRSLVSSDFSLPEDLNGCLQENINPEKQGLIHVAHNHDSNIKGAKISESPSIPGILQDSNLVDQLTEATKVADRPVDLIVNSEAVKPDQMSMNGDESLKDLSPARQDRIHQAVSGKYSTDSNNSEDRSVGRVGMGDMHQESLEISELVGDYRPVFVSSAVKLLDQGGAKLLLPTGIDNAVIAVYEDEPTSLIAYALTSKQYQAQISDEIVAADPVLHAKIRHAEIYFGDENLPGKGKYSVVCYCAKQFNALRKKCCPTEIEFVCSLSRCKKWGAQGGKSKVFFAKTLDDRFIIKQVTKTELESFLVFAPEYFKRLTDLLSTGSRTCLAKILGIYQVTIKHSKGVKDVKMALIVMENLFFGRTTTQVYDLKGSLRNRYNPDSSGVLLDQNFIETMLTSPVFVGNKAKKLLGQAVWNDTSFLSSINVMDYSLLVGVDEERRELVLGIIDYIRQYTWDKHLETWVKASGILGGPKKEAPTVISPMKYKKRFRKAMSTYFQIVPDLWYSNFITNPSHSELTY